MSLGKLKLRDMKLTRAEKSEEAEIATDRPDYPYGLTLSLNEESIDKLGIELPDVGDTFFVLAIATVRSVSEHQSDDHTSRDVSLQIEQLSLDGEITKS